MTHNPWVVTEAPTFKNSQIFLERAALKTLPPQKGGFSVDIKNER